MMRSTLTDAKEQAGATGNISSGAGQLQRLIHTHAQMSEEVAITADRLAQLAEGLRALLPDYGPSPSAGPQVEPTPEGPLRGPRRRWPEGVIRRDRPSRGVTRPAWPLPGSRAGTALCIGTLRTRRVP